MSHPQQRNYVQSVKNRCKDHFHDKTVLEVGSLNINGTIRDFFTECDYTGIDVGPGKGVDIVIGGHQYDAPTASFDVVASCECFEHNPYWAETFTNMIRLCKPGGLIFFTCATTGRKEHGTRAHYPDTSPLTLHWNYYRNLTEADFREICNIDEYFSQYRFDVDNTAHDLYFFGIRK
jgi:SAM-dependent methyltransferase